MPKKSNKTDHVLSLLTNGPRIDDTADSSPSKSKSEESSNNRANSQETALHEVAAHGQTVPGQTAHDQTIQGQTVQGQTVQSQTVFNQTVQGNVPPTGDMNFGLSPQATPSRVIVEGSKQREDLSNLVKLGLEEELKSFARNKVQNKPFLIVDDRDSFDANMPVSKVYSEEDMEFVTSKPYILEDFNENEGEVMSNEEKKDNGFVETECAYNPEEYLHNMAEDIIKSKAPEIMKSLNMCTCTACIFDVIALALNHTQPLYTVTKKGELFQKLASFEMQYGSDITREITKACLKIKVNPRHEFNPNR